uniref:Uncharacterized protein n=1 Tax=Arundo donax TaxID=35708 RepID=A0A0A9AEZ8_ARUDO
MPDARHRLPLDHPDLCPGAAPAACSLSAARVARSCRLSA